MPLIIGGAKAALAGARLRRIGCPTIIEKNDRPGGPAGATLQVTLPA
jgi:hypothetical protein